MKRIVGSLIVCWVALAVGQQREWTVREVTEKVQRRYQAIRDATAQFTQHVKFGFSQIEQNFAGTLTMKKPSKYRIVSEHQTFVTDGSTVWAYSPVNKQVLIDRYKENENTLSPEQFLLNLPANYYSTLLGGERSGDSYLITLKLVPKDDQSFVKSMKVWVEEGSWMVRKVEMVDVNDTEKTYTVQDVRINTNVRDDVFAFTPPPGTEVVDLR
ncbi:MAG: outer membrane lipoprotein chaperone LolA [Ignavibacteria bacterium]|nr:outer membrane lipoprotein chaperone LolA [Ignavibacteria bacterium]